MSPADTSTIRVGAGGIMLPNHAPLVIAEQFGTLASLYPGRIDLGLGRAPGTDQLTARALRRDLGRRRRQLPAGRGRAACATSGPASPGQAVRAVPGAGPGCADLDPGLQPVRRPAGRGPRPALRLRLAFRAAPADGRPSRSIAARFRPSEQLDAALRHAGRQRRRRRHRRRGAPAVHLGAAGLRQPAHADARARCRRRSKVSRRACHPSRPLSSTTSSPAPPSARPARFSTDSPSWSAAPAPMSSS